MTRLLAAVLPVAASLLVQAPQIDTLGPRIGTRAPEFRGVDQFGRTHTLRSLFGPEGLMLVFYRSADW